MKIIALKIIDSFAIMLPLFIFLCLIHCTITLKCYDCINCPYPWSSFGIQTYGSIFGIFSRVQSCYVNLIYKKKPIDLILFFLIEKRIL